jgi:hypothetical protein
MKVKELIEKLNTLDPEMLVLVDGYEGDYTIPVAAEQIEVSGPYERPWYYGQYQDAKKDDLLNFTAFILRR